MNKKAEKNINVKTLLWIVIVLLVVMDFLLIFQKQFNALFEEKFNPESDICELFENENGYGCIPRENSNDYACFSSPTSATKLCSNFPCLVDKKDEIKTDKGITYQEAILIENKDCKEWRLKTQCELGNESWKEDKQQVCFTKGYILYNNADKKYEERNLEEGYCDNYYITHFDGRSWINIVDKKGKKVGEYYIEQSYKINQTICREKIQQELAEDYCNKNPNDNECKCVKENQINYTFYNKEIGYNDPIYFKEIGEKGRIINFSVDYMYKLKYGLELFSITENQIDLRPHLGSNEEYSDFIINGFEILYVDDKKISLIPNKKYNENGYYINEITIITNQCLKAIPKENNNEQRAFKRI